MKPKNNYCYARLVRPGRTHICLTTETRFAHTCIVITVKPVRHMNRLKIRTEEITMIALIISFIAGAAFGITIMCVCTAAGRTDRKSNTNE